MTNKQVESNLCSVIAVNRDGIVFSNGSQLYSKHEQDCCEDHWLDFSQIKIEDFDKLLFDLSSDNFFSKIDGYGIELNPVNGWSVKIPGYGSNNGYYSSELTLVLSNSKEQRFFDISECQEWE